MTDIGFNIRATAGYVTDVAPDVFQDTTPYPGTAGIAGFTSYSRSVRDRTTTQGAELAGVAFAPNSQDMIFRCDIDPGPHEIRVALGDFGSYGGTFTYELYDGLTIISSVTLFCPRGSYIDATGVVLTGADWPTLNSPLVKSFSSGYLQVISRAGGPMAHISVTPVVATGPVLEQTGGQANGVTLAQPTKAGSRLLVLRNGAATGTSALMTPGNIPMTQLESLGLPSSVGVQNARFATVWEAVDVPAGITGVTLLPTAFSANWQEWSGIDNASVRTGRQQGITTSLVNSMALDSPVQVDDDSVLIGFSCVNTTTGTGPAMTPNDPWVQTTDRPSANNNAALYAINPENAPASQTFLTTWGGLGGQGGVVAWGYPIVAPVPIPPQVLPIPNQNANVGVFFTLDIKPYFTGADSYTSNGTLPPGVTLDGSAGILSGDPTTAGVYTPNIVGVNVNGLSVNNPVQITVTEVAPVWSTIPAQTTTQGDPVSLSVAPYCTGADITYSVTPGSPLPAGLSISAAGLITGTPTTPGTSNPRIRAVNSGGTVDSAAFVWTINSNVAPPVWTTPIPDQTNSTGDTISLNVQPYQSGGTPPITYSATGIPPGITFNAGIGTFQGNPTTPGSYFTVVTASNSAGAPTDSFNWQINAAVVPPVLTPVGEQTSTVGDTINYDASTHLQSGSAPITWSATNLPSGVTIAPSTGLVTGTVGGAPQVYVVTLTATNSGGADSENFNWTVAAAATAPVWGAVGAKTNVQGTSVGAIDMSLSIVSGTTPITYTSSTLPPGLAIAASTGVITGTPTTVATTAVTIRATNVAGFSDVTFNWTINPSIPAIVQIPTQNLTETIAATPLDLTAYFTGTVTSYGLTGTLPAGLTRTGNTISGTPPSGARGTYPMVATATNVSGTSVNNSFNYVVVARASTWNTVPTQNSVQGTPVNRDMTSWLAAYSLPYTVVVLSGSLPTGLSMDSAGLVTGTPTVAGTFPNIVLRSNNAAGNADSNAFSWIVSAAPQPPVWSTIPPQTNIEDSPITPLNVAPYCSGDTPITFSATFLPAGLSMTAAGVVSGTPVTPGISPTRIDATNAAGGPISESFNWTITAVGPPVWGAIPPQSSLVNTPISAFDLSVYVTGGTGPFTFTEVALPTGLDVSSTGTVTGTPTVAGTSVARVKATGAGGNTDCAFDWGIVTGLLPPDLATLPNAVNGNEALGAQAYDLTSYNTGGAATSWTQSGGPPGTTISNAGLLSINWTTNQGTWFVTIRATNSSGFDESIVQFIIASSDPVVNTPPPSPRYNTVGTSPSVSMGVYISGATSWSATGLPAGMTINTSSGVITGTLTTAATYNPVITAVNIHGNVQTTFQWIIEPVPVQGDKRYGRV